MSHTSQKPDKPWTRRRWRRALEAVIRRAAQKHVAVDPEELIYGAPTRFPLDEEGRPCDLTSRLPEGVVPSRWPHLCEQQLRELDWLISRRQVVAHEEAAAGRRREELYGKLAGHEGGRVLLGPALSGVGLLVLLVSIEALQNVAPLADLSGWDVAQPPGANPWAALGTVGLGLATLSGLALGAYNHVRGRKRLEGSVLLLVTAMALAVARLPEGLDLTSPRTWAVLAVSGVGAFALSVIVVSLERPVMTRLWSWTAWKQGQCRLRQALRVVRGCHERLARERQALDRETRKLSKTIDEEVREFRGYHGGHTWSVKKAATVVSEWIAEHAHLEPEESGKEEKP